jgi:hypothetical protein
LYSNFRTSDAGHVVVVNYAISLIASGISFPDCRS